MDLPGQPGRIAAEPNGRGLLAVALGSAGPQVLLLDATTGGVVWSVHLPGSPVAGPTAGPPAGWLPDGRYLIATATGLLIGDGATGRVNHPITWAEPFVGDPEVLQVWPDGRISVTDSSAHHCR